MFTSLEINKVIIKKEKRENPKRKKPTDFRINAILTSRPTIHPNPNIVRILKSVGDIGRTLILSGHSQVHARWDVKDLKTAVKQLWFVLSLYLSANSAVHRMNEPINDRRFYSNN